MKSECIKAVQDAAGRELRKAELDEIQSLIRKQREMMARQDRTAYLAMSQDAQIAEAARRAGQQLVADAAQHRRDVVSKINAHARITAAGGDTYEGMLRFIESHSDDKSTVQSLESIIEAETKTAVGGLLDTWEAVKGNFFGIFHNVKEEMDLLKELHGETSGNARAQKGASAWKEVTEGLRQKANAVGIKIPLLEDWVTPRSYDQAKTFKLGRDATAELLLANANRQKYVHDDGRYYTDDELRTFFGHAWESIATDGANKVEPTAAVSGEGNAIKFTLSGARRPPRDTVNKAARGSLSRQIHLKDAAAYAAVHKAIGGRDLYASMLGHVQSLSAEISTTQQFGVNPGQMLEFFLAKAQTNAMKAGLSKDYAKSREYRIRNSFNYIAGNSVGPVNERVARWGSGYRQWQVASKLGSAAVTSIGDQGTMAVTAQMNGLPPFKVWLQALSYMVGAKDLSMARRAGLGTDSVIGTLNRFGYENTMRSFPSRLANAVMQLSLLNRMTDANKAGFGSVMLSTYGDLNAKVAKLADLHPEDNRILLSKGITERDWAIWKLAKREDWGAGTHDVLTPNAVMRISDAELSAAGIEGDLYLARNEAMQKLTGAMLEETDTAILTPRASERARIRGFFGNYRPGTGGSEIVQNALIFKSYPMSFMMRNGARMMGQDTYASRFKYAAAMVVATTLAGMAAQQVSQVISGKDPKDMFKGKSVVKNWVAALLKGGSLGIYGDFLFSPTTRYGSGPVESLLGPAFQTATEVTDLTIGNIQRGATGKDVRVGAGAVSLLKANTPGASLWYAKAAFDHWIFQQMQEALSPGYLRKTKARAEREFGDSYWWEPGTAAPQRPPNLGKAVGQ